SHLPGTRAKSRRLSQQGILSLFLISVKTGVYNHQSLRARASPSNGLIRPALVSDARCSENSGNLWSASVGPTWRDALKHLFEIVRGAARGVAKCSGARFRQRPESPCSAACAGRRPQSLCTRTVRKVKRLNQPVFHMAKPRRRSWGRVNGHFWPPAFV